MLCIAALTEIGRVVGVCVTHRAFSSGDVAGGEAYLSVAIAEERVGLDLQGSVTEVLLSPCSPKL